MSWDMRKRMGSSSLMGLLIGFDFRFRGSWQSLWAGQKTAGEKSKRTGSTAANTHRLWGWVARLFTFAAFCRVMKRSTYKLFASHYLVQRYVYVRIVPSLRKLPSLLAPLFADETSIAARSEERWLFSQVSYFFVGDKSRMMLETDWSWGLQISFWDQNLQTDIMLLSSARFYIHWNSRNTLACSHTKGTTPWIL